MYINCFNCFTWTKSTPIADANGIEFAQNAFSYHFGSFGTISLFLCVFMFSFSTILTGYYYGECCFKHIFKNESNVIIKLGTIIIVFVGSIASSNILCNVIKFRFHVSIKKLLSDLF